MKNTTSNNFKEWLKEYKELKSLCSINKDGMLLEIKGNRRQKKLLYKHVAFFENILRDIVEDTFPFYDSLDIHITNINEALFYVTVSMTYYYTNKKCYYNRAMYFQNLEDDVRKLENHLIGLRYGDGVL